MEGGREGGLSTQGVAAFREGIELLLSQWSALQLAVENEWGGRDSRCQSDLLRSDVFSWFTQSKEPLYTDDLENILDEALLYLNTVGDDGSIEEVSWSNLIGEFATKQVLNLSQIAMRISKEKERRRIEFDNVIPNFLLARRSLYKCIKIHEKLNIVVHELLRNWLLASHGPPFR